jgi:hypothetical protein
MQPDEIVKSLVQMAGEHALGRFLEVAFGKIPKKILDDRLYDFHEDLRDEFSLLLTREGAYDAEYLKSQDFAHLVLLAADHAVHTKKRVKRAMYARVLRNAASIRWGLPRCDLAEELLNTLAELSPIEVEVLSAAWVVLRGRPSSEEPAGALAHSVTAAQLAPHLERLRLSDSEMRAYLGKLQRWGLTEEIAGAILSYAGGNYRLTPLVERLMELLTDDLP